MLYKLGFRQIWGFARNSFLHLLRMTSQIASCLYRIKILLNRYSSMVVTHYVFQNVVQINMIRWQKSFGISDVADVFHGNL